MAHTSAAQNSGCGIAPTIGNSLTYAESAHSTGRKANSVMTASTTETPRFSMMSAKRMVSSWMRWDAPSILRTVAHCAV